LDGILQNVMSWKVTHPDTNQVYNLLNLSDSPGTDASNEL
jgi:hypothetical protein